MEFRLKTSNKRIDLQIQHIAAVVEGDDSCAVIVLSCGLTYALEETFDRFRDKARGN